MMPLIQPRLYELGRRLGQQGPRRLSRPRRRTARVSPTGVKSVSVEKYGFKILQFNANGLGPAKIQELGKFLIDESIQVALIQETMWSKEKDVSSAFPGFTPYRCECKRRCQGIVTLVNNSLNAEVKHITTNDENDIQLIKLWKNGQQFSLYNLYSPPNTACSAHLNEINFQKTIIAGDTNAHSPVWGYADTNASGDYIEDIVNSTNLILLQNKDSPPTFFHRPSGALTRPDSTLVSADLHDKCSWKVSDDLGSDHLPIIISIDLERERGRPRGRPAWNYSKADWDKFKTKSRELISQIDFEADIDTVLTNFSKAIINAAEKSVPRGFRAKFKIYWSGELDEAINKRRKAKKALIKNKNPENRKEFNKLSAKVRLISKMSKKQTLEKKTGNLDLRKDKCWSRLQ